MPGRSLAGLHPLYKAVLVCLVLVPFSAAPLRAAGGSNHDWDYEETRSDAREFTAGGFVHVRLSVGDMHIKRGDTNKISLRYTVKSRHERNVKEATVDFDVHGREANIEFHLPSNSNTSIDVELIVPQNTNLDVHDKVGDVIVEGVEGDKDLSLGVGDIRVANGHAGYRLVNASTSTGDQLRAALQIGKIKDYFRRNTLRATFALAFTVCASTILGWGQHPQVPKATTAELLDTLRSDDAAQRADAYEHLRSDTSALRSATVKTALLDLLDRENSIHESAIRERVGISDKFGEGYTEYVYDLGGTVASFVNWNDPHQVCTAVRGFVPEEAIANHAKATIPCLLQKAKSDLGLVRGRADAVLVQALAKGRNNLDPSTIEAVQQIIRGALHDPDALVRTDTVEALGHYGSEDMIPALKDVADKDPSPDEEYAIRRWATEAIVAIQKRAGQD